MRNLFFYPALILGMSVLLFACKKDEEQTTAQKIQARWNFQKTVVYESSMGGIYRDTIPGIPGDYVDFRSDGKLYSYTSGLADTSSYQVLGSDKLVLWSDPSEKDTMSILALTNSQLTLFLQYNEPGYSYEGTTYLVK